MNTQLREEKGLTEDYKNAYSTAHSLNIRQSIDVDVINPKRFRKYLYEIGLKCDPKRRFRTIKITNESIRACRIE